MSVIAWDGKTLAADKKASNGFAHPVTKIYRAGPDMLVGICGHAGRGLAMVRWIQSNGTFPKANDEDREWARVLAIHRDGRMQVYESNEWPFDVEGRIYAIGSGRDFALMGMHLGLSAAEAVLRTCDLSAECGLGVDVLAFEDGG